MGQPSNARLGCYAVMFNVRYCVSITTSALQNSCCEHWAYCCCLGTLTVPVTIKKKTLRNLKRSLNCFPVKEGVSGKKPDKVSCSTRQMNRTLLMFDEAHVHLAVGIPI